MLEKCPGQQKLKKCFIIARLESSLPISVWFSVVLHDWFSHTYLTGNLLFHKISILPLKVFGLIPTPPWTYKSLQQFQFSFALSLKTFYLCDSLTPRTRRELTTSSTQLCQQFGIKAGPHWWETSALTSEPYQVIPTPSLLLQYCELMYVTLSDQKYTFLLKCCSNSFSYRL